MFMSSKKHKTMLLRAIQNMESELNSGKPPISWKFRSLQVPTITTKKLFSKAIRIRKEDTHAEIRQLTWLPYKYLNFQAQVNMNLIWRISTLLPGLRTPKHWEKLLWMTCKTSRNNIRAQEIMTQLWKFQSIDRFLCLTSVNRLADPLMKMKELLVQFNIKRKS